MTTTLPGGQQNEWPQDLRSLHTETDELIGSRRHPADGFIRAAEEPVGLHRKREPVRIVQVCFELGNNRERVRRRRRSQHEVRAEGITHNPGHGRQGRINRENDAAEVVNGAPITGIVRGRGIGRHDVSNCPGINVVVRSGAGTEDLKWMIGRSADRKRVGPPTHQGDRRVRLRTADGVEETRRRDAEVGRPTRSHRPQ